MGGSRVKIKLLYSTDCKLWSTQKKMENVTCLVELTLCTCWIVYLIAYSFRFFSTSLSRYLLYGKLAQQSENNHNKSVNDLMHYLWYKIVLEHIMPEKQSFVFYYIIASIWNVTCWLYFYKQDIHSNTSDNVARTVIFVLYQVHLLRRLYECLFLHQFSNHKRIPLLLFGSGAGFYVLSCPTIALSVMRTSWDNITTAAIRLLIGIIMILIGNYHQYSCHKILAKLRDNISVSESKQGFYRIPRGNWFEFVSCPHYFSEILIYVALVIMLCDSINVYMMTSFVILNLSVNGVYTHRWYHDMFKEQYPRNRMAVIPFIL